MIKKGKQINKGTVKDQTNKDEPKKKVVSKVYECIICGKKEIATKKPITCVCSNNGNYVVNNNYIVGE